MVQIIEFAILVIVISASGVMAPGPLFAANITYGLREGVKSGIKIAIGHSIVELPLVILLGVGVFSLEIFPEFRMIISIFGAITLFVFAGIQIKTIFTKNNFISTKPNTILETFGSALKAANYKDGNCNSWYVAEMAEKRALSRATLKMAGLYEHSVFGEDESESFKRA